MHSVSAFAGPCWRSSRTDKSARRCHRNHGIRGRRAHILRRIVRCYLTAVCSRGNEIICLHEGRGRTRDPSEETITRQFPASILVRDRDVDFIAPGIAMRDATRSQRQPPAGPSSPSRSRICTGGVSRGLRAVPLRCTHIPEAVIPSAGSLGPSLPSLALCQLFSRCLAAGIASHRIASHRVFSCGSRPRRASRKDALVTMLREGYRNVAPVRRNNVPVNSASACTPPRDVVLFVNALTAICIRELSRFDSSAAATRLI